MSNKSFLLDRNSTTEVIANELDVDTMGLHTTRIIVRDKSGKILLARRIRHDNDCRHMTNVYSMSDLFPNEIEDVLNNYTN